jgi:hypothetical protein
VVPRVAVPDSWSAVRELRPKSNHGETDPDHCTEGRSVPPFRWRRCYLGLDQHRRQWHGLSHAGLEPKCLNTKRKAACVATSGPSLGRKRPRRAAIVGWGWGRYRIPLAKTIALSGSTERRDHGPIRRFTALALKAEHFCKVSKCRHRQLPDEVCPRKRSIHNRSLRERPPGSRTDKERRFFLSVSELTPFV